jgi:hypothetical protein
VPDGRLHDDPSLGSMLGHGGGGAGGAEQFQTLDPSGAPLQKCVQPIWLQQVAQLQWVPSGYMQLTAVASAQLPVGEGGGQPGASPTTQRPGGGVIRHLPDEHRPTVRHSGSGWSPHEHRASAPQALVLVGGESGHGPTSKVTPKVPPADIPASPPALLPPAPPVLRPPTPPASFPAAPSWSPPAVPPIPAADAPASPTVPPLPALPFADDPEDPHDDWTSSKAASAIRPRDRERAAKTSTAGGGAGTSIPRPKHVPCREVAASCGPKTSLKLGPGAERCATRDVPVQARLACWNQWSRSFSATFYELLEQVTSAPSAGPAQSFGGQLATRQAR